MTFSIDDASAPIVLDVRIRDWVLFPILVVMFLVALVRHWAAVLAHSDRKPTLAAIQERQTLLRSERLRAGAKWLWPGAFHVRKAFLGRGGILDIDRPEGYQQANPMVASVKADTPPSRSLLPLVLTSSSRDQGMDQGGMADAMKNQVMAVVPQLAIMGWVSAFFSGFVVITLPFVLTPRFKAMLQRGIEGAGLDFCHVSSLSWYVLNLLGLRGLTALFLELGDSPVPAGASDAAMLQAQMGMPPPGQQPGMPPDIVKSFRGELENLDILVHRWDLDHVESRILGRPIESTKQSQVPPSHSPPIVHQTSAGSARKRSGK